jgi:hypothetical protein
MGYRNRSVPPADKTKNGEWKGELALVVGTLIGHPFLVSVTVAQPERFSHWTRLNAR